MASDPGFEGIVDIEHEDEEELKEPEMYRVLMHNDHYTTMEFVVGVLRSIFHKPLLEATRIMMDVHRKGLGIVGVYTYDIAATKVAQVKEKARENEYPLLCTIERV